MGTLFPRAGSAAPMAAGLALALVLATGGCAPAGTASGEDPVIWYDWEPDQPAMQALLTTTLELRDGCLMGSEGTYLAFPRGLGEWDPETNTLEYGDGVYGVGDPISAGGGGTNNLPADAAVPPACIVPEGATIWLVQTTSLQPSG